MKGFFVGHASDFEGLTGVAVILTPSGMAGGIHRGLNVFFRKYHQSHIWKIFKEN
ncbi:MAG: hypothetical protein R6T98_12815 [Desulfatiglandales bacterium]